MTEGNAGSLIKLFPVEARQDPRHDQLPGCVPVFFELGHQLIFRAIVSVWERTGLTSPSLVAQELLERNQLELVGGPVYLGGLEDDVFTLSQAPHLVGIILEKWRLRSELAILGEIQERRKKGDSAAELYRRLEELRAAAAHGTASEVQNFNGSPSLADYLATPRAPLHYHIKGVLPERGKMTISAVAKGFKTTLLIELGICAAAGDVQYLNFEFGGPSRVLLVQPELSDALLAERFSWILRTAPDWLDKHLVAHNFSILETSFGRPSLWHVHPRGAQSRREVEAAIERTSAQILLVDSLYMSFAGMDENAADQMTLALDYLGELANRYGVAIILSHHFNKSGTAARGSSVYQGWGETDLSISTPERDTSVVKVEALMRCAFPKGFPAYWRKPDESTAWFELLPEGWTPTGKGGRPQSVGPAIVPMVIKAEGRALRWAELHSKIMESGGVKKSRADELIREAKEQGLILVAAGVYTIPSNQPINRF